MNAHRRGGLDRRRLILAGAALAAGPWARAQGDASAREVQQWLPGAREQGRMQLRWFGLAIYEARLWTLERIDPLNYAAQSFVLELRYARSLRGEAIAERSLEEMQRQQPLDPARAEDWRAQMGAAFPDVQAGDRLSGWHRPGRGTHFFHNGRPTRELADAQFGVRFFGIWLSPRVRDAALRDALLGAAG